MSRRTVDWNDGLAKDLRNPRFAQEFIQAALEDGLSIQAVLGKVIRAYGIKEFAAKVKMPSPNLLRAVNTRHNPTIETVNRLLRPFALELTVMPAGKRRVA